MKRLNFLLIVSLMLSFGFVSCKKDKGKEPNPITDIVEDGVYIATSTNLNKNAIMAVGINENGQMPKDGLYEKYMALEGGKDFTLTMVKGSKKTVYGAMLKDVNLAPEGNSVNDQPVITIKKGTLAKDGKLQVTTSGLYHIVADFNLNTVIIAPVEWGVRGAMNGWGFTALKAPKFDVATMTYTLEKVKVESKGAFKFAYGKGWKIQLDEAGDVKVNTNLGLKEAGKPELKQGGGDIAIERGIYTISLKWSLKDGSLAESFEATITKTEDLPTVEFDKNTKYSFIGNAIFKADGSVTNWDYDQDFTFVKATGNTIVYEANNVKLGVGSFKIRKNHDWGTNWGYGTTVEGADFKDDGGNFKNETEMTYSKVQFIFEWDGAAESNVKLVFTK